MESPTPSSLINEYAKLKYAFQNNVYRGEQGVIML